MPKIKYLTKYPRKQAQAMIAIANEIIAEYEEEGIRLTLRQLYYQFVSRDLIANTDKMYTKLGNAINAGRLGGFIDWEAIVDHTRSTRSNPHWDKPQEILQSAAQSYARDKWATQDIRCEVWIEKEALLTAFQGVCRQWDVPYFCCRGYTGQSAMWEGAMRMHRHWVDEDQHIRIFHFGDHDPSGIDMTRDIQERLLLLSYGAPITVERMALNMDQIEEFNPPPNPAKLTDTRAKDYVAEYGDESWELDALSPKVLRGLVETAIGSIIDMDRWKKEVAKEKKERVLLEKMVKHWPKVTKTLKGLK